MRIVIKLAASAALASLLLASPALAEGANTIYGKLATGYILKDVGVAASDQMVLQGGFTHSWSKKFSSDVWVSTGPEGGTANEFDGSLFYDDQIGPVKVQLSAQYYALNLNASLLKPRDDLVEFYADVSLPKTYGRVTIAPVVRTVQMVGVRDLPSLTLIQPGVRLSVAATNRLSVNVDVRDSIDLTRERNTLRWTAGLSYQFSEHLSGQLGLEGTDRTNSVASFGFRYSY